MINTTRRQCLEIQVITRRHCVEIPAISSSTFASCQIASKYMGQIKPVWGFQAVGIHFAESTTLVSTVCKCLANNLSVTFPYTQYINVVHFFPSTQVVHFFVHY